MSFVNLKTAIPGPKSLELKKEWKKYEVIDKLGWEVPVVIDHGHDAQLYDVDGNRFIDWTSGVIVANVGHSHPILVKAMQKAAESVLNVYEWGSPYRIKAAADLIKVSPEQYDKCFFLSTGAEATDCASRVMKRYTGKYEIVSFFGGFHGRTLSTASMGGLKKTKKGMGPMMPGAIRIPYPYCYRCPFHSTPDKCKFMCIEFGDDVVRANSTGSLAGFIGELYQGAGGYVFPPNGYFRELEKWIRENNMLFTLDEVQSSYGRTGTMWAQEQEGITPDITTLGKGIGGGAVVTALLLRGELVKDVMHPGDMGSTYGGNPVSCAAVSAVIQIFKEENVLANAKKNAVIFSERLPKLLALSPYVGDVRGRGMAWGVEFVEDKKTKIPAPDIVRKLILACASNGLLLGPVGRYGNVLRISPPLVMSIDQTEEGLKILEKCVSEL